MEIYTSKSEKDTFRIAQNIASHLTKGDVLALTGDLGSGKTTFVKGLAQSLGIKSTITSPTFVIMKNYAIPHDGQLVHVDCYRLSSVEDAESLGLTELLDDKDSIVVLEWPERIKEIIPSAAKFIRFTYISENIRKIEVL